MPAPSSIPFSVSPEIPREAAHVALDFLEKSFSIHGQMLPWNAYAKGTEHLQKVLLKRYELVQERRTQFDFGIHDATYSFTPLIQHLENDVAYFVYRSIETCSFTNPSVTTQVKITYFLTLVKEGTFWRIQSVFSDDGYFRLLESFDGKRLRELRNAVKEGESIPSIQAKMQLRVTESELEARVAYEKQNIARELAESSIQEQLPPSTGENRGSFDREAMRLYQEKWALGRNPEYFDISQYGGDCQNYVSQVIFAGGAPMDEEGTHQWYYYGSSNRSYAWTAVQSMQKYLLGNTYGKGPRGVLVQKAQSLLSGDTVHIDRDNDGSDDHAVAIFREGSSPTITGHTRDQLDYPLHYIVGAKKYFHLVDYGN